MSEIDDINFCQFVQQFPDENATRLFFERIKWGHIPYCGHCGSEDVVECKNHKPMPYRCRKCRQHFSVRTGTVLMGSRLPLHKWLMAIYMMTVARKNILLTQLARELGITKKSARFLAQRIRETWMNNVNSSNSRTRVKIDEIQSR